MKPTPTRLMLVAQRGLVLWLTFMVAAGIKEAVIALVAAREGVHVYFTRVGLVLEAPRSLWINCQCVAGVYVSGPLAVLVLGAVLWTYYRRHRPKLPWQKYIVFWLGGWLLVHFCAGWLAGVSTQTGLWYVWSWMYLPLPVMYIASGLLWIPLAYLGWRQRRHLFRTLGMAGQDIEAGRHREYWVWGYGLPFFVLVLLLTLWYAPAPNAQVHALVVAAGGWLLTLPMLWSGRFLSTKAHTFPPSEPFPPRPVPLLWVLGISLILLFLLLN